MGLMFKTLAAQELRYKRFLFFLLLLALITGLASAFTTRLTGEMGQAALNMDTNTLLQFLLVITILMIVQAISSGLSALIMGRFGANAGYRFRDNFAKYFLKKPFAAYDGAKSGESLSILSNDIPAAVTLVSTGGMTLIANIINLLIMFGFLFFINWWLTLIFIASFPVLIVLQVVISKPIQKKSAKRLEARADVTSLANDSFQNVSTVVSYSLENVMRERYLSAFENWIFMTKSMARSYLSLILAGIIASMAPLVVIIVVSAGQVIDGGMNIAEMIAFVGLASEAGSWLMMLSQQQNNIQTAAGGAKRFDEHMSAELEDVDSGETLKPSGDVVVCATGLTFAYGLDDKDNSDSSDADEPGALGMTIANPSNMDSDSESNPTQEPILALDDVSFEIKKGSRVAFVGGSGSGKSTVLKLLLGLYAPQSGSLSVMGTNIAGVSLNSLRELFSYVPQDSFLFPESILGNITGKSTITDKPRLEKACRDAGILDFINTLPHGFDSELGEAAENVSGGQKQRIAIARAFYRDSPIILVDEATSALDPATEVEVLQSLNALSEDKTVIMVAHRLRAIDFCDTIVVMDGGKVAAIGSHDELIKASPIYAGLYDTA
ncbi:MAG: ABC transporter ATP-binding protein/permease [Oscillospiraceae bacterium]|nr:ABC transporter ATP-binding protein/permease [Oscillospiraceae bacterium]